MFIHLALTSIPIVAAGPAAVPAALAAAVQQTGEDQDVLARPQRDCDFIDSSQRAAPSLWSDGVVYFEFDANVSNTRRELMYEAMEVLMELGAAIAFVPRTPGVNDTSYVHIQDSTGNNSFVGDVSPGQAINIFNWNFTFIMAHELLHALGFWHEHTRWDRDGFVTIESTNIQSGYSHNFTLRPVGDWVSTATPYDFDSVMHYSGCTFSTCCPSGSSCACAAGCETIRALPAYAGFQASMGQRSHVSVRDGQDLVAAYGAGLRPRYVAFQSTTFNAGTLLDPYESLAAMDNDAPAGSTVYVQARTYDEGVLVLDKHLVLKPYGGVVTIR